VTFSLLLSQLIAELAYDSLAIAAVGKADAVELGNITPELSHKKRLLPTPNQLDHL